MRKRVSSLASALSSLSRRVSSLPKAGICFWLIGLGASRALAQSDSAQLVTLNRGYVDAFIHGRSDWYDAHLRPTFVSVSPDGSVVSRDAFVNGAKQPMTYRSFGLDSVQVQILGDLALISAITPWERADGSKGVSRYTDIWTRQNGEWKAVHAQITWIRGR